MKKKLSDKEKLKQIEEVLDYGPDLRMGMVERAMLDLWTNFKVRPTFMVVSPQGMKILKKQLKKKKR